MIPRVKTILTVINLSKVSPAIIVLNSINMIDEFRWPFTGHNNPNYVVFIIRVSVNLYSTVAANVSLNARTLTLIYATK